MRVGTVARLGGTEGRLLRRRRGLLLPPRQSPPPPLFSFLLCRRLGRSCIAARGYKFIYLIEIRPFVERAVQRSCRRFLGFQCALGAVGMEASIHWRLHSVGGLFGWRFACLHPERTVGFRLLWYRIEGVGHLDVGRHCRGVWQGGSRLLRRVRRA